MEEVPEGRKGKEKKTNWSGKKKKGRIVKKGAQSPRFLPTKGNTGSGKIVR